MKIKSLPQYERPMEKCLSLGVESLTNGELIAILINSGTKERSAVDLAEEVLAKDQAGIGYLRESSLEELMTVKGIGSSKAARIVAAVELGKRIALKPVQKRNENSRRRRCCRAVHGRDETAQEGNVQSSTSRLQRGSHISRDRFHRGT